MILSLFWRILRKKMFLSFMNYFAIQCFPDTYNLVREGPNITPHVTDLMVRAKKILGHEGRCERLVHGFVTVARTVFMNRTEEQRLPPDRT